MTTYNTGAPVPSVDVRDLYDNAENLDNFSNGAALAYTDRKGVSRQSLAGIRAASSYQHLGAYGAGLVFTSYNQTFSYLGEFYAPSASITLPYITTGVGAAEIANFRSVGDAVLRQDLANEGDPEKGSAIVGYLPDGSGALGSSALNKLRESVSAFDFMTQAQVDDVRANSYTIDVTAALQSAFNFAASRKVNLLVPAGGYLISAGTVVQDEWGLSEKAALLLRSDLSLIIDGCATFKMADGQSTDAAPVQTRMLFTNEQLSNISIVGRLILDANGQNNPISPNRATNSFNRWPNAHIQVSGTVGGVAARINNVVIDGVEFWNNAGVSCIVMAQSNTALTILGENWLVKNCKFRNNGLDSDDHSSIYGWADNVTVENCLFENDTMHGPYLGGYSPCEMHGKKFKFINNRVKNYYAGPFAASNFTSGCDDQLVAGNTLDVRSLGVWVLRSPGTTRVGNVKIYGNTIVIDGLAYANDPAPSAAVYLGSYLDSGVFVGSLEVDGLHIQGNTARRLNWNNRVSFLRVAPHAAIPVRHKNINVCNNSSLDLTRGVDVGLNSISGVESIEIINNSFCNFLQSIDGAVSAGLVVSNPSGAPYSTIDLLRWSGNSVVDLRASHLCQYGAYIEGVYKTLHRDNEVYAGIAVANYTESSVSVDLRSGNHNNIAFTPTWTCGFNPVTVGNGSVSGVYNIREREVSITARLLVGSTTAFPAGQLSLLLPIDSRLGSAYIGAVQIQDAPSGAVASGFSRNNPGESYAFAFQVNGAAVTSTSPIAFGADDVIDLNIRFLA